MTYSLRAAGGTGERVAREPLTGRVSRVGGQVVGSGPVGERAAPTALRAQGPLPLGQDPQRGCTFDDRVNTA